MDETVTIGEATEGLFDEGVVSLDGFDYDASGAWPKGWYAAEIIEGYATAKGKVFTTEDGVSQKGDSRNARLCFKVTGPSGDQRTMQDTINYRPSDFTPERVAYVKQARAEHKGARGRWNDDPDAQRSSLALVSINELEKATGFTLRNAEGFMFPARVIGQKVDVRLKVNEDGFNDIGGYAKAGTGGKKEKSSK
jgi:hypothetical protein